jgi:hypothetical protein
MESNGEPTYIADERTQLEEFLDSNRAELVETVRGLTDEQARRRLVPSLTTPLGLIRHAAFAEQVWFHVALAGRTRTEVGIPETVDESFALADEDTVEAAIADYERVCAEAREIAAGFALDDVARHNRRGPLTLRWIYVHMVEELARHAGHADILREQILNADS